MHQKQVIDFLHESFLKHKYESGTILQMWRP